MIPKIYITLPVSVVFNTSERVKISANTGKVWRVTAFTELY
jgi:hypothetical protein